MSGELILLAVLGYLILGLGLGYGGAPLWGWLAYGALILIGVQPPLWVWGLYGLLVLLVNVPWLRQRLITAPLVAGLRSAQVLPTISATERAAIEAGTVGVEGEFFNGRPNWQRLLAAPYPQVPPEVQAFLDGPVEQVCRMATDWEIYERRDLPPEVWAHLKQARFFGMMIPPEYGGLGFSNLAYSAVMAKLASRSFTHVATVGVTNSLGPAKLLLRYGTPEQKARYLPRLAQGEDIPCFALTEPQAGSDAASLTSRGEVFQGTDGQLYLRLNWRKRYITLGAIATLLGLAFRLYDPNHLLGEVEDLGITCALVPTATPGVVIDHRHDPMGVPFYNSPTEGHDVVVPLDHIIGGVAQAGQGWKMLMQTLAAGRGVSFPASCTGVAQLVSQVTGAYAVVRRQFGLPIGRFEGVAEPLARIGGLTYLLDALRLYTVGAVDQGEQPAVVAAIAKYQSTELTRKIVSDGMDILGGAGICRGPRNLLANLYTAMPIAITVEGANILTRTLIIFGQGAIRSHPYVYAEIAALEQNNIAAFDRVIWPHLGATVRHLCRTLLLSLTRGRLARAPVTGATAPYYRRLTWAAATFALFTDGVLLTFGGSLKRREALTGRFADWLSWLYLGTAILRRYEAEGRRPEDLPFIHWGLQFALTQMQESLEGILANLPPQGLLAPLRFAVRLNPLGTPPRDALGQAVAQVLQTPGVGRDRITPDIFLPTDSTEALGRLEHAFELSVKAEGILAQIKQASRSGILPSQPPTQLIDAAVAAHAITAEDREQLLTAMKARLDAIQVDAFPWQPSSSAPTQSTTPAHVVSARL
ncbi:acyl-CoA dehydrogenase [Synechococcales cyanobacterium C]|uniref:Acyl-coenzyme A dehydrogenase n=1 Tax=Petrachloros mirabilis ULC683 TaxID=2781853 RepID=A0A8K2A7E2_9CYAN|nr:acyl-CoA dehydrogenase [Petrachloros mirabilis]NCJ06829.1 acyl-CoA dehydrogenase [Petrachloros mirabilis ULC683]